MPKSLPTALLLLLLLLVAPLLAPAPTALGVAGGAVLHVDPSLKPMLDTSDAVRVLIVARPPPPGYLEGLSHDDRIALLKEWSSRILAPIARMVAEEGGVVYRSFWLVPAISAEVPGKAIPLLASQPGVVEVISNTVKFRVGGAIKPLQAPGGGSAVNWGVDGVNATAAWRLGYTGLGVRVAVLDTGVDVDHPALKGKLFTLVPGDPFYPGGWIAFDDEGRPQCVSPYDSQGHGTFVASDVLGGDTNYTILGVAPEAQLMAALVLPNGEGTPAQVLAGFEWAADPYTCNGTRTGVYPNIVVFSAGWVGYTGSFLLDAIKALLELGVIVVSSIGNEGPGTTSYPANIWGVYGVGAVNETMGVAGFSGGGVVAWPSPPSDWPFKPPYPEHYVKPDFAAPGVNVAGAVPGGGYGYGNGTSFAAAHLAGVAALVLDAMNATGLESPLEGYHLPELVYDVIANTSLDLGEAGLDTRYGWGVANGGRAVEQALRILEAFPVRVAVNATKVRVGEALNLTIEAVEGKPEPPEGAAFTIYLDGRPVGEAVYHNGRAVAVIRVPEAPMGSHLIEARSKAGFRGAVEVTVEPSITLEPSRAKPYTTVTLIAEGHPANAVIEVLLDGVEVSRLVTNGNGTGVTGVPVPSTATPGPHVVETLANGSILARATLTVYTPRILSLAVAAAPLNSTTAVVYVLVTLDGSPVEANLSLEIPPSAGSVLSIESVAPGLYKALVSLQAPLAPVLVNASYRAGGVEARGAGLALLYSNQATGRIVSLLEEINSTLQGVASGLGSLSNATTTLEELAANATEALGLLVQGQGRALEELEYIAALLEEENASLARLEARASYIQDQLSALNASLSKLGEAVAGLEDSAALLRERIDALASTLNATAITIVGEINASTTSLEAMIASESSKVMENTTKLIEALQGRMESLLSKYQEGILNAIESMGSSMARALNETRDALATLNKAGINSVLRELRKLEGELSSIENLIQTIEQHLESAGGASPASPTTSTTQTATSATGAKANATATTKASPATPATPSTTTTHAGPRKAPLVGAGAALGAGITILALLLARRVKA